MAPGRQATSGVLVGYDPYPGHWPVGLCLVGEETMKKEQLEAHFEKQSCGAAAVIAYQGERGVAYVLGERLSKTWASGDVIVLWSDGEHTVLPDEFDCLLPSVQEREG